MEYTLIDKVYIYNDDNLQVVFKNDNFFGQYARKKQSGRM